MECALLRSVVLWCNCMGIAHQDSLGNKFCSWSYCLSGLESNELPDLLFEIGLIAPSWVVWQGVSLKGEYSPQQWVKSFSKMHSLSRNSHKSLGVGLLSPPTLPGFSSWVNVWRESLHLLNDFADCWCDAMWSSWPWLAECNMEGAHLWEILLVPPNTHLLLCRAARARILLSLFLDFIDAARTSGTISLPNVVIRVIAASARYANFFYARFRCTDVINF